MAAAPLLAQGDGWVELFNGRNLDGWRAQGDRDSFQVVDGVISANGPMCHLFYNGDLRNADFLNFELAAEVMARPGANSGIYFHTTYQDSGWPVKGFEAQVNNSSRTERRKTGSLYKIRDFYKQLVPDNEWFELRASVRGKNIQVQVNGVPVVDYIEPEEPVIPPGIETERQLDHGTFALQCHDPGSNVLFRSIRVRPLADDLPTPGGATVVADDLFRKILLTGASGYPMVDLHVHAKGGLSVEDAVRKSHRDGIMYGLAVNCGQGFDVMDDASARAYVESLAEQPVFIAMQAEGREWTGMFSREAVAEFDYVFTDSMTWTDNRGRRMRTWIPEEVGEITDPQEFMDTLVDRAVGILENEPIDIYVNPTYIPDQIAADYESLWTEERRKRIIDAAVANDVAIELNSRRELPSPSFIRMMKEGGCKFTLGTNNAGADDLGRSEYGLRMIEECELEVDDFFLPLFGGATKAVERKGDVLRSA